MQLLAKKTRFLNIGFCFFIYLIFMVYFIHRMKSLFEYNQNKDDEKLAHKSNFWNVSNIQADFQISELFDKLPFDNKYGRTWTQGFEIEYNEKQWNKNKKLNVIIVPHSHNDPGWLLTFEQYFERKTINILDTVVNSLIKNRNRTFIWSEISYLAMWWKKSNHTMQQKLKHLILNSKQMEIVTGGWVMNDEANTNYYAMIEQLIQGHEWLRSHIDKSLSLKNAWAIDPFGYSPTMTYLLKQIGLENMVIQRVHYHLKKYFAQENRLEFNWIQSWSNKPGMFCHVMPFLSYSIMHSCGPDPKVCCQFDFISSSCPWGLSPGPITETNIKENAELLLDQFRKKSQLYGDKDNHDAILVPLGNDFYYDEEESAEFQFKNFERLIAYMNSREDFHVNVRFGTLADYFNLAKKNYHERSKKIETFSGDFFTYADKDHSYWSGYYTSRPFQKHLDRLVESYLRSAEIIYSISLMNSSKINRKDELKLIHSYRDLLYARHNLGLFQHHDGITGTSKTAVVLDYQDKLLKSIHNSIDVIEKTTSYLLTNSFDLIFKIDDASLTQNIPINLATKDSIKIVIYNSNLNKRYELVKLKIKNPNVEIVKSDGTTIQNTQISFIWPKMKDDLENQKILNIYEENLNVKEEDDELSFDKEYFELTFQVELDPLSLESFKIRKKENDSNLTAKFTKTIFYKRYTDYHYENNIKTQVTKRLRNIIQLNDDPIRFDELNAKKHVSIKINKDYRAFFSSKTGLLEKIVKTTHPGKTLMTNIDIVQYGASLDGTDKSGAYLFIPNNNGTQLNYEQNIYWFRVEYGRLSVRVCVKLTMLLHCVEFNPTITEKLMLKHPHFSIWNMIDLNNFDNTEISLRIKTNINNNKKIYTDLNGFQFTKRKFYDKLPLQANVYPMPVGSFIQDSKLRLNVLTAQPLGVIGHENSSIQVFLDRRLNQDDARGLEQRVVDNVPTGSKFIVFFEEIKSMSKNLIDHPSLNFQLMSNNLLNPVVKLIQERDNISFKEKINLVEPNKVPCGFKLVNLRSIQNIKNTFEPMKNEVALILHRLASDGQNLNEATAMCSNYINNQKLFNFEQLFHNINDKIKEITHTHLDIGYENASDVSIKHSISDLINPMEIRAFKVKF